MERQQYTHMAQCGFSMTSQLQVLVTLVVLDMSSLHGIMRVIICALAPIDKYTGRHTSDVSVLHQTVRDMLGLVPC